MVIKYLPALFTFLIISFDTDGFEDVDFSSNEPYFSGQITKKHLFKTNDIFLENYENYSVEENLLTNNPDFHILILFGLWCHDSKREVPKMLKILDSIGLGNEKLQLVAVDIEKNDPENLSKSFNLKRTPTFIIFKDLNEIGRIVERPNESIEKDLLNIIEQKN
tara:strand:+ start:6762 stop:7253 length:492 start_codon:yes stop_codon:yes gene_type:complete